MMRLSIRGFFFFLSWFWEHISLFDAELRARLGSSLPSLLSLDQLFLYMISSLLACIFSLRVITFHKDGISTGNGRPFENMLFLSTSQFRALIACGRSYLENRKD